MIHTKNLLALLLGIAILVFSSISINIGGGFLIGLILGINDGMLALMWKTSVY